MTERERNLKLQRLDCAIQQLEVEAAQVRFKVQTRVAKLIAHEKRHGAMIELRQAELSMKHENVCLEYRESTADSFEEE